MTGIYCLQTDNFMKPKKPPKGYALESLTLEATPWQPNFLKGLTKLAILPNYGLLCLAFPPRQKSGLILVIKSF